MPPVAKQGDLDGLCGVYSVHNAVTLLWPDEMADPDNRDGLFAELISYMKNQGIDAVEGTFSNHIADLLALSASAITRFFPDRLVVRRPWRSKRAGKVEEWLPALGSSLAAALPSVAIIGLWKPAHWTVTKGLSDDKTKVLIADSGTMPEEVPVTDFGMYRSKAEYELAPKYTFLLTRV